MAGKLRIAMAENRLCIDMVIKKVGCLLNDGKQRCGEEGSEFGAVLRSLPDFTGSCGESLNGIADR
jgi:hypothetical protein